MLLGVASGFAACPFACFGALVRMLGAVVETELPAVLLLVAVYLMCFRRCYLPFAALTTEW